MIGILIDLPSCLSKMLWAPWLLRAPHAHALYAELTEQLT